MERDKYPPFYLDGCMGAKLDNGMRVECKGGWEDKNGMVIKMKQSQKVTGPQDYFSFVSLQSTLVNGLLDAVFKIGLY